MAFTAHGVTIISLAVWHVWLLTIPSPGLAPPRLETDPIENQWAGTVESIRARVIREILSL